MPTEQITPERRRKIVNNLTDSEECACGRPKAERQSHCRKCYFSLPGTMRRSLWRCVGAGYEEAYLASLEYLREHCAHYQEAVKLGISKEP